MGFKDGLAKRKDGSYVLKHKTKKSKKGDCVECGLNPETRMLLFRYNTEDMLLVRGHIENHLLLYFTHDSITPIWCEKCQALQEYICNIDSKKMYKRDHKAHSKELAKEAKNETSSYV